MQQNNRHAAALGLQAAGFAAAGPYDGGPRPQVVSLAALLLLWNLSVPQPLEQRLGEGDPSTAQPARLPPLQDSGWQPAG
ncbi:MAG: hypothetical protein VKM98_06355 [Cyanobacteriota bacterium]|nr:hypothetical protein [Cyanobacteriota bacterium]